MMPVEFESANPDPPWIPAAVYGPPYVFYLGDPDRPWLAGTRSALDEFLLAADIRSRLDELQPHEFIYVIPGG